MADTTPFMVQSLLLVAHVMLLELEAQCWHTPSSLTGPLVLRPVIGKAVLTLCSLAVVEIISLNQHGSYLHLLILSPPL